MYFFLNRTFWDLKPSLVSFGGIIFGGRCANKNFRKIILRMYIKNGIF